MIGQGGRWWPEYAYVVYERAVENPMHLPSTKKFLGKMSCTGKEIVRDQGHAGWRLSSFCEAPEAVEAALTEAEVRVKMRVRVRVRVGMRMALKARGWR